VFTGATLNESSGQALEVLATLSLRLSLAHHRNAVPFLRELVIVNGTDRSVADLHLSIASVPPILTPKTWRIEVVGPDARFHVTDRDIGIDTAHLVRLTETEAVTVAFTLTANGETLASRTVDLDLLPRNQWGGIGHVPELVAAFVQPNDPVVDRVLKRAADTLRAAGRNGAIDGYAGGAKRVWELASAIWSAVAGLGLAYSLPPASFEQTGQKVRSPSQILDGGVATCLDTTLLFAACLEQAGLHPLVVFTRGHAFVGVWLKREEFTTAVVDDAAALRKRVKLKELVLFETTLATHRPAPGFAYAAERAAAAIAEPEEDKFELAVDVRRCRMQRILPLASAEASPLASELEPGAVATAPDLGPIPDLPDETEGEDEAPATPQGRIERWQRKLLDLSLRNGLLNFRAAKRSVRLLTPEPARVEDLLADGKKLRLLQRPEVMEGKDQRDAAIHEARHHEDARRALAIEALERLQLFGDLDEADLDARLTELYRAGRAALQEGGANVTFLAFGFLSWTREGKADKAYRAPLVLVPVTLERKSIRSGFSLALHEDEARFNPTLLEMLRQDFRLSLPIADGALPADEHGLDITGIWQQVQRAVKDLAGWEVVEEVVLSTFSFAKHLMWKDLVERTEQLKVNSVVRHLIETPRDPYPSSVAFPDRRALDRDHGPEETFCPLPADSSQLTAVMAAARGKDFVLIGPPGTGKSQTIANIIAQCLAERKTVLFVSEKIAALDVVYRRLKAVGLGEFCLELHSNKARKTDVLEQLRSAWDAKGNVDAEVWRQEALRLRALRNGLNDFVERMHRRRRNGLTVYAAMGRVVGGRDRPEIGLSWPTADHHGPEGLTTLDDLVTRLDVNLREVGSPRGHPLATVVQPTWSPIWQQALLDAARAIGPLAEATDAAGGALFAAIGIREAVLDGRIRVALSDIARLLPDAAGRDLRFVLRPDAPTLWRRLADGLALVAEHAQLKTGLPAPWQREVFDALTEGCELVHRHRSLQSTLVGQWSPEALRDLDTLALLEAWKAGEKKGFLFRGAALKKVRAAVDGAVRGTPPEDLGPDLERLAEMRRIETRIATLPMTGGRSVYVWRGVASDLDAVAAALRLRAALAAVTRGETWTDEDLEPVEAGRCGVEASGTLAALRRLREIERELAAFEDLGTATAGLWAGLRIRAEDVEGALRFGNRLTASIMALSETPDRLVELNAAIGRLLGEANVLLGAGGSVAQAGRGWLEAVARFDAACGILAERAGHGPDASEPLGATPSACAGAAAAILGAAPRINAWCGWRNARQAAAGLGLGPLVDALETGVVAAGDAAATFKVAYARWWLNATVDADGVLSAFVSAEHERRIDEFRALDERFVELTKAYVRASLCGNLPDPNDVTRSSEWGLLKREMEKKKRHIPLRELVEGLPTALTGLTPCLLMSPLSIAQYLTPEKASFDVVVFDEASQIPVWDAVGAIARGRQVVMVGDPKQLPPTAFFDKAEADDPDDDVEGDLESILDECLGANLPTLNLSWHYRSRHESLIAFSNHRYYGGGLVTFPSPVTDDRAVSFHLVQDGVYEKGGARINKPEAKALVADLVAQLKDPSFVDAGLTAGVVTFNAEQQKLVEDLLDAERRKSPEIEAHFSDDRLEPVFVKNLENVQGDERDVMWFSLAYGPAHVGGPLSMNFGPMNRDGGQRRLNVAVTRARHGLRVFASFTPDRIDLSRTQAEGVRDLKHFLEFAERGPRALAEANVGSVGGYESPFEEAVAAALKSRGWTVHPQVGVSAFRIDLGVVDPDRPGRYLAGVECDGATYHRAATARDRDKLREQVLRGLGWDIVRIWSTDWWIDRDTALDRTDRRLRDLLDAVRARRAAEAQAKAAADAMATPSEALVEPEHAADVPSEPTDPAGPMSHPVADPSSPAPQRSADDLFAGADFALSPTPGGPLPEVGPPVFREVRIEGPVDPEGFLDKAYDPRLAQVVRTVVEAEGPIREDVLCRRIARIHGWSRTGGRIVDRVVGIARAACRRVGDADGVVWYWPLTAEPARLPIFRRSDGQTIRPIDEIPIEELRALAAEILDTGVGEADPVVAMARIAGLQKVRADTRARLEVALREEQAAREGAT
jgi:very-short-patch-repair endonuclease